MANSRDAKPGYPFQPLENQGRDDEQEKDREGVAAPPDAGGHLGAHTQPGDVLQTPDRTRKEEDLPPDLQYTDSGTSAGGSRAPVAALIGILLLALALFILFWYGFYDPD